MKYSAALVLCAALIIMPACNTSDAGAQPRVTSLPATLEAQGYHALTLQRVKSNHDLITATINGQKGLFLVDTGAAFSIIHSPRAARFNLQSADATGQQTATLPTGTVALTRYRLRSVSVDGNAYRLSAITRADLGPLMALLRQSSGRTVDGIIGQDFLIANQAVVDVGGGRLYLRAP